MLTLTLASWWMQIYSILHSYYLRWYWAGLLLMPKWLVLHDRSLLEQISKITASKLFYRLFCFMSKPDTRRTRVFFECLIDKLLIFFVAVVNLSAFQRVSSLGLASKTWLFIMSSQIAFAAYPNGVVGVYGTMDLMVSSIFQRPPYVFGHSHI